MKKLLALVLALVMTLGLATVSSSAAYSDKADIEYTEAADVMTALGVFQGKGDAFAPKDNLNRAEAAKLIAYLMLGNKTAESMTGSGTRFTDVPASHWAAGYIEYLASVGIVSGVGNNQFNPNGQVTAVQFAKMLLVALGYDADLEGFVGEGWSINIQKLANKNDLFETLEVGTNDALTREQAAQMCLNDLKADMVKYSDKGTTVKIGESTVVTGAKEAAKDEDVGNKNYNNSKDANGDKKYLQLAESLYGNDIKLDEGQDDFGRPTNTWNYKNIKVGEYADNAQLIATATEKFSRKSLYDALGKDQYDNIKDGKTFLYVYENGKGGKVDASKADTYMDRNDTTKISNTGNGSLTQVYLNDNGSNDVVRVVTTHTYVWQVTNDYNATRGDVTIKAVGLSTNDGNGGKPNDHIITLKDKTLKDDDFEAVKGLKKDDYVLITAYTNRAGTASYEVDSIAKAELKSGKVDSFTKSDTVTIDGTKTKYSNMAPENDEQKGATYTVGEEARFVMDKYGYVIAVDELVVNNNYVFVANIASTGGLNTNPEGDAYFTDGTNEAIRINKVGTDDGKNAILGDGVTPESIQTIGAFSNSTRNAVSSNAGWYTYSKASNGKYNLNKLGSSYLQVGYVYDATSGDLPDVVSNDKVAFLSDTGATQLKDGKLTKLSTDNKTASTLRANDKTIFVVEQDGDVNVYTGLKNAPNVSLARTTKDKAVIVVAYDKGNSYAKYVYITLTPKAEVDGGQNTALFYVLKRDTEDVVTDQKDYEMWYVIDENGKDVLVKTDTKFMNANKLYRAYYKTFKNSSDEYTKVTPITNSSNNIAAATNNKHYIEAIGLTSSANGDANDITFNNGSLFVGGEGFTTTSDTKIILVITAKDMKVNTDKNYEIENYTGNGDGLEQKFNDYSSYTYSIQGRIGGTYKADNKGDSDLKEIYITVTAASKIGAAAANTATLTPKVTATNLGTVTITNTTKTTNLSTSAASVNTAGDVITVTAASATTGYKMRVSAINAATNAALSLTKLSDLSYRFTMPADGSNVNLTVDATAANFVYAYAADDTTIMAQINNDNITIAATGQIGIPVTVTHQAFGAAGSNLVINGKVFVDDVNVGTISTLLAGGQTCDFDKDNNVISKVILLDPAKVSVPTTAKVEVKDLTARYSAVNVLYLVKNAETNATATASDVTTIATTNATINSGAKTNENDMDLKVDGTVYDTTNNASATVISGVEKTADTAVLNTAITPGTQETVYTTIDGITVTGKDYVRVVLNGLVKAAVPVTVFADGTDDDGNASAGSNADKLYEWAGKASAAAAGFDATDGAKVLTITASPNAATTSTGYISTITATLGTGPATVYGYSVRIKIGTLLDETKLITNNTPWTVGTINVTENIASSALEVTVTEVTHPLVKVSSGTTPVVNVDGQILTVEMASAVALNATVLANADAVTSDHATDATQANIATKATLVDDTHVQIVLPGTPATSNGDLDVVLKAGLFTDKTVAGNQSKTITLTYDKTAGTWSVTQTK